MPAVRCPLPAARCRCPLPAARCRGPLPAATCRSPPLLAPTTTNPAVADEPVVDQVLLSRPSATCHPLPPTATCRRLSPPPAFRPRPTRPLPTNRLSAGQPAVDQALPARPSVAFEHAVTRRPSAEPLSPTAVPDRRRRPLSPTAGADRLPPFPPGSGTLAALNPRCQTSARSCSGCPRLVVPSADRPSSSSLSPPPPSVGHAVGGCVVVCAVVSVRPQHLAHRRRPSGGRLRPPGIQSSALRRRKR